MTRKTFHGESGRGTITLSPDGSDFIGFGPHGFKRAAATDLFSEKVDAEKTQARSDSFWGGVLSTIGEKAAEIGTGVFRGYSRHSNAAYAHARTGIPSAGDVPGEHPRINELLDRYGAERAPQSWLKDVTGKSNYVYGAAVPDGPDEGIYVDGGLVRKAGKYISNFTSGFKNKAREYASDFVETLLTLGHEYAHKVEGIRNEIKAEQYAVEHLNKLAVADSAVGLALKEYRGRPFPLAN